MNIEQKRIEEIRQEHRKQEERCEALKQKKQVMEDRYEQNNRRLTMCIWILFAVYAVMFMTQLFAYKRLPLELREVAWQSARIGKWVVCILAIILYAVVKHNEGSTYE